MRKSDCPTLLEWVLFPIVFPAAILLDVIAEPFGPIPGIPTGSDLNAKASNFVSDILSKPRVFHDD